MSGNRGPIYRFDDVIVEPSEQRVTRGGTLIEFEPKAFDVLAVLLARAGTLVPKSDLLEVVWPETHVGENSLSRAVAQLRKSLGDDSRAPRLIETVPTRGYRFLRPVQRGASVPLDASPGIEPPTPSAPVLASGTSRGRRFVAWGALLLSAIGLAWAWSLRTSRPAERVDSSSVLRAAAPLDPSRIAVLPFADLGTGDERLAVAMTEQVVSLLSRVDGLRVLPRTSTQAYAGTRKRAHEIGSELAVGSLLEGSLQREGEVLRVTVQLIDTRREEIIWSEQLDRRTADFFATQTELALRVAESLRLPVLAIDDFPKPPTSSFSAYDLYLRGRELYRRQTRIDNEEAVATFELALERDGEFAHAWAGLANAFAMRAVRYGFEGSWLTRAEAAARRALELDPDVAQGHKALGLVLDSRSRLGEALAAYQRAIELDPTYSEALYNAATVAWELGQWREAIAFQRRDAARPLGRGALAIYLYEIGLDDEAEELATQVLEAAPLTSYLNHYVAARDIRLGHLERAGKRLDRLLQADPSWSRAWRTRGDLALARGDLDAAEDHYERAVELLDEGDPDLDLRRALVRRQADDKAGMESFLDAVEISALGALAEGSESHEHHYLLAAVAAIRGRPAEAIEAYGRAIQAGRREVHWDLADPAFAPLRVDPGFEAAVAEVTRQVAEQRQGVLADLRRS